MQMVSFAVNLASDGLAVAAASPIPTKGVLRSDRLLPHQSAETDAGRVCVLNRFRALNVAAMQRTSSRRSSEPCAQRLPLD